MLTIKCNECDKSNAASYYITSCGDQILCNECTVKFIKKLKSVCKICNQKVEIRKHKIDDTCAIHHKKCDFYCQTCQSFLCGDCILDQFNDNSPHKGHSISKIEDILDDANTQAIDAMNSLLSLQKRISLYIKKYDSIKTQIESSFDETMISMHSAFRTIQEHVHAVEKKNEDEVMEIAERNEILMEEIKVLVDDSEEIFQSNDPQIATAALCVIDKIKRISSEKVDTVTFPKISFRNELVPDYSTFQIEIPNFVSSFKGKTYKTTYTPPIDIFHGKWRAKIHASPKGDDSHANLSVFIELLNGYGTPFYIDYKVQIRHPEKSDVISRAFKSEFNVMDSWGWTKFAVVDTIISEGFVQPNDTIIMDISIRPSNFAEYSKIYESVLKRYRDKYHNMKEQIKKLEDSDDQNDDQSDD
ncbi:MATH domain containing protein [Tritrichomonas foetus]|uniref:MATH domain containing protein n=1 Tax=Tritrichomonas foetus TaxID=1144522 RepID=A0A1J4L261_9EUKA|nr:MATH domain containing protein [Tritrichomonas foetus]|eukprot:OHT17168.1 MATH domain containing protein [Tritrichomonas foetus]